MSDLKIFGWRLLTYSFKFRSAAMRRGQRTFPTDMLVLACCLLWSSTRMFVPSTGVALYYQSCESELTINKDDDAVAVPTSWTPSTFSFGTGLH